MLILLHLSVLPDGATLYVGDLLRFDPAGGGGGNGGVWTDLSGGPLSNPPSGRAFFGLASAASGGQIYVFGGQGPDGSVQMLYIYLSTMSHIVVNSKLGSSLFLRPIYQSPSSSRSFDLLSLSLACLLTSFVFDFEFGEAFKR